MKGIKLMQNEFVMVGKYPFFGQLPTEEVLTKTQFELFAIQHDNKKMYCVLYDADFDEGPYWLYDGAYISEMMDEEIDCIAEFKDYKALFDCFCNKDWKPLDNNKPLCEGDYEHDQVDEDHNYQE